MVVFHHRFALYIRYLRRLSFSVSSVAMLKFYHRCNGQPASLFAVSKSLQSTLMGILILAHQSK